MTRTGRIVAALAVAGLLCATPARADIGSEAAQLRRLDIMLMVTSLRCRATADNFQRDFQAFEAAHLTELNAAANELREGLVSRYGAAGASRALDRLSTSMANRFGQGHPTLNCAQLKMATRTLARMRGRAVLVEAANELLGPSGTGRLALAGQ